jgi:hypothetical protein
MLELSPSSSILMQTSTKMSLGQLKFVIGALLTSMCVGCGAEREVVPGVTQVGTLANPAITESSGVVASRQYTNVFWTHNDGGKSETLFAINREGKTLSEFKVLGAKIDDWEDIATDNERHLYIADTGDNDAKRKRVAVYRIDEPDPASTAGVVRTTHKWQLRWPNGPVDSEGLFVYGTNGYLVTKVKNDRRAEVYRFQLNAAESQMLEPVARLTIDSPVTAAGISSNGAAIAFVAANGLYVYPFGGDISKLAEQRPYYVRFRHDSMEACTFVPEGLLTTTESKEIYLFTDERFRVLR